MLFEVYRSEQRTTGTMPCRSALFLKRKMFYRLGVKNPNKEFGLWLMQEHKRIRFTTPIPGTLRIIGYREEDDEPFYGADFEEYYWAVELNTIDEMISFMKSCGHSIWFSDKYDEDSGHDEHNYEVMIVDGYIG